MIKQDQYILDRFLFLEKILERYKTTSFNQILPILDNPQVFYESHDGKPIRICLCAIQKNENEVFVLLSELLESNQEDYGSWFTVGFKKLKTEENIDLKYDQIVFCSFCDQYTKFNYEMPMQKNIIYHCIQCRNFFEPTSLVFRFVGATLCLFFSLISVFIVFVGALMLYESIRLGHFYSLYLLVSVVLLVGGLGVLFISLSKVWHAYQDPMLNLISDFKIEI